MSPEIRAIYLMIYGNPLVSVAKSAADIEIALSIMKKYETKNSSFNIIKEWKWWSAL